MPRKDGKPRVRFQPRPADRPTYEVPGEIRGKVPRVWSEEVKNLVFTRYRQLKCDDGRTYKELYEQISAEMYVKGIDIPPSSVQGIISQLRPTTELAKAYIRSKAYRLAKRLVREATSTEILDLLSRPSMNVIAPKQKETSEGDRGFFLSVQIDSCGAATTVAAAEQARRLPAATVAEDDVFDMEVSDGRTPDDERQQETRHLSDEDRRLQLLENARQKLALARQEHGRQSGLRPGPDAGTGE